MVKIKYGTVSEKTLEQYKQKLTGRVFKILPMREEGCDTLSIYIESLLYELLGNKTLIEDFDKNSDFLSLLGTLENLKDENDLKTIKREVFKCLELIKKI